MTKYVIQDTETKSTTWALRAKGIGTRPENMGQEVDLVWTIVRGMTDGGQPAWDTSGDPIRFLSSDDAECVIPLTGSSGWNFKKIPGSEVTRMRTEKRIVKINEFGI